MHITFDTHKIIKELESKKFTEEQAEAIVKIITETRKEDLSALATKQDLKELELKLTIKLGVLMFSLLLAFKVFDKFL